MSMQSFYALKLLILICALLRHIDDVKENFYEMRFTMKNLLLLNLTENLKKKSNLNLYDFHHVLNISVISNGKQLEQIKFRHLSKLNKAYSYKAYKFIWDPVATSSHDPEKVVFNFRLKTCHLVIKIFFLKDFVLLFHQNSSKIILTYDII